MPTETNPHPETTTLLVGENKKPRRPDPAILLLTLTSEEFRQERGKSKREKYLQEMAGKIGYDVKMFTGFTPEGYRRTHIIHPRCMDMLLLIEESEFDQPFMFVQSLPSFLKTVHPYVLKRLEYLCVLKDAAEIEIEASREAHEQQRSVYEDTGRPYLLH